MRRIIMAEIAYLQPLQWAGHLIALSALCALALFGVLMGPGEEDKEFANLLGFLGLWGMLLPFAGTMQRFWRAQEERLRLHLTLPVKFYELAAAKQLVILQVWLVTMAMGMAFVGFVWMVGSINIERWIEIVGVVLLLIIGLITIIVEAKSRLELYTGRVWMRRIRGAVAAVIALALLWGIILRVELGSFWGIYHALSWGMGFRGLYITAALLLVIGSALFLNRRSYLK